MAENTYEDWMNDLAEQESGGQPDDGYGATNPFGYLGRYQMGEGALTDMEYVNPDGTLNNDYSGGWTGKDGVNSSSDFLTNHRAQDGAFLGYTSKSWDYIRQHDLNDYVGTTINGVQVTISGMLAAAHLIGRGGGTAPGLKEYLESNGAINPADGNGVTAEDYLGSGLIDYSQKMNPSITR